MDGLWVQNGNQRVSVKEHRMDQMSPSLSRSPPVWFFCLFPSAPPRSDWQVFFALENGPMREGLSVSCLFFSEVAVVRMMGMVSLVVIVLEVAVGVVVVMQ